MAAPRDQRRIGAPAGIQHLPSDPQLRAGDEPEQLQPGTGGRRQPRRDHNRAGGRREQRRARAAGGGEQPRGHRPARDHEVAHRVRMAARQGARRRSVGESLAEPRPPAGRARDARPRPSARTGRSSRRAARRHTRSTSSPTAQPGVEPADGVERRPTHDERGRRDEPESATGAGETGRVAEIQRRAHRLVGRDRPVSRRARSTRGATAATCGSAKCPISPVEPVRLRTDVGIDERDQRRRRGRRAGVARLRRAGRPLVAHHDRVGRRRRRRRSRRGHVSRRRRRRARVPARPSSGIAPAASSRSRAGITTATSSVVHGPGPSGRGCASPAAISRCARRWLLGVRSTAAPSRQACTSLAARRGEPQQSRRASADHDRAAGEHPGRPVDHDSHRGAVRRA